MGCLVCPRSSRPLRLLALHGYRTSGDILSFQMGALQAHTNVAWTFPTAPHPARGPPDEGVALVYSGFEYFEWLTKEEDEGSCEGECLEQSLELLLRYLRETKEPYDGVLGFSQGANVATRLAHLSEEQDQGSPRLFRFVILIGGVPPKDLEARGVRLKSTPSLHIHGLSDPLLAYSQRLYDMYESPQKVLLQHGEGHNIPSLRTDLYGAINAWLSRV